MSGSHALGSWFVTSDTNARALRSWGINPGEQVHAKTYGTTATACGEEAVTWSKLWDVDFEDAPRDLRCKECAHIVGQDSTDPG